MKDKIEITREQFEKTYRTIIQEFMLDNINNIPDPMVSMLISLAPITVCCKLKNKLFEEDGDGTSISD